MTLETPEPKKNGVWRYIQRNQGDNEYAFHGVNHEVALPERIKVTVPERIIITFELEGLPEKEMLFLKQKDLRHYRVTGQN